MTKRTSRETSLGKYQLTVTVPKDVYEHIVIIAENELRTPANAASAILTSVVRDAIRRETESRPGL